MSLSLPSPPSPDALSRALHRPWRRLTHLVQSRWPWASRLPPLAKWVEWAARAGYGGRGFVYLSAGALSLLAATDHIRDAAGSSGAAGWLAGQPYGQVWLLALGISLWAFVLWRAIQAIFDPDRHGTGAKGLAKRGGQALSGVFYGVLAATVFEYLDEYGGRTEAEDTAENQQKAAEVLALPFGEALLILIGLIILAIGLGNLIRALREDFTEGLDCSDRARRWAEPLARAGYGARGLAYLPLAVFVLLAGLRAEAGSVTSFAGGLEALERQPGGSMVLGALAAGLMAFGAFAFVEARWRRIRAPKELS
ncbi:DUF1206 domain-containing protein [Brevundimonas sp. 2R-24]|uniref:DUF1206 domain-containing protein n=1 Tax=Peiella sedimenti TaxID=3061083 RepID=A0ABT8SM67_9CAUL|nr:DUF1206 domain-containing protein [Caulobacteraceae bacterium XZ-24]